jgi:hypothetical protein
VRPGRAHRDVRVRDGDDARSERDLAPFETVGIAASVVTLVVVADDRQDVPWKGDVLEKARAGRGVLAERFGLVRGHRSLCGKSGRVERRLPDVLEQAREHGLVDDLLRKTELVGHAPDEAGDSIRRAPEVRVPELQEAHHDVHRLHQCGERLIGVVVRGRFGLPALRLQRRQEDLRVDEEIARSELKEIRGLAHRGEARDQHDPAPRAELLEARALPASSRVDAAGLQEHEAGGDGLQDPLGFVDAPREGRREAAAANLLRERLSRLGVLRHDHDPGRHTSTPLPRM